MIGNASSTQQLRHPEPVIQIEADSDYADDYHSKSH